MPKADTAKTTLARSWRLLALLLGIGIILFVFETSKEKLLRLGQKSFKYEVADTSAEREKGLSGRSSLPAGHAMLFVFDSDGEYCFWMKDMRFSVDMIWLDAAKKVVDIETNVNPDTYPQAFCPAQPASYVVEVNAGMVKQTGLQTGQSVKF